MNKSFVWVRLYYLYLPMDVCTIFFLHIFNKKFLLQFICNKLISTTAHESVKIISTKMVYAYLTPDFRKHISRELWYILFVWSLSVMQFLRPLLKHLMSVRPFVRSFVRPSVRFLQSATPLTVTTQLIDVKLYNVLEIHCSCAQWFLDFSLNTGWRG